MKELKSVTALTVKGDLTPLKDDVTAIVGLYKDFVVHADNIKEAKQIMADMNKAYKFVDDKRKEIKKAYTAELTSFESEVKQILSPIPEVREGIKIQLDEYEQKRIELKRKESNEIMEDLIDESNLNEKFYGRISLPEGFTKVSVTKKAISDSIKIQIMNAEKEQDQYNRNCKSLQLLIEDLNVDLINKLEYKQPSIDADFASLTQSFTRKAIDRKKSEDMAKNVVKEEKQEARPEPVVPVVSTGAVPKFVTVKIPAEDWENIKAVLDYNECKYEVE